jgi:3-phytase
MMALVLAGCGTSSSSAPQVAANVALPMRAQLDLAPGTQPNDVAIVPDSVEGGRNLVLGANGEAGLVVFSLDGQKLASDASVMLDYLTVSDEFSLRGKAESLVIGYDSRAGALTAFVVDPASFALAPVTTRPLAVDSEVTGLCAYRSPNTGSHYVFAATDSGFVRQWELYERDGKVDGRVVRTLPMGVGVGYCAVDERSATLYVTEESVGIWKIAADPETDAQRELVDLVGSRGHLTEEVKGLAVYPLDGDRAYLLAADVAAGRINVYSTNDSAFIGSFSFGASALKEAEGLAAADGVVAIADQNDGAAVPSFRLANWSAIAGQLKIEPGQSTAGKTAASKAPRVVKPSVETEPVDDYGDAADDPAIWVHPTDPSRSLIIGAQKKRGLYVYDLSGKTLQVLPDGRMNNVDLRSGFKLGTSSVAIVAASNRTTRTLALYKVDTATRRLVDVALNPIPTGFRDPYGLCLYRSAKTGDFYAFMNDSETGAYKQWRLRAQGDKVVAEVVREFTVGTQAEGCAADDETGALYVAEEDIGLWRYEAEPDGADRRVSLDTTTDKGNLDADVEGIAIYYGERGTGYVLVSNQGSDNYAVYRREGRNEFLGFFAVGADPAAGIDGASETDGLDVTSTPLGPGFPHGVFVAQDGRNITPDERQNFKLVPWERIANVLSEKLP